MSSCSDVDALWRSGKESDKYLVWPLCLMLKLKMHGSMTWQSNKGGPILSLGSWDEYITLALPLNGWKGKGIGT